MLSRVSGTAEDRCAGQVAKCRNRCPYVTRGSHEANSCYPGDRRINLGECIDRGEGSRCVPSSAFFLGVGGGYNVADFGTQNVYAVGTSNVYQNGLLTSSGSAAGPANVETNSQSAVAFSAQGGYFQHFYGSDWLWGAKFAYSLQLSRRNFHRPKCTVAASRIVHADRK
jgi:hypothetical protein